MNPIEVPDMAFLASLQQGCVPFDVSFLELSDPAISVTWHFGDGQISNDHNPIHTYTFPGNFPVVLDGYNSGACKSASDTMFVTVIDTAHVNFTTEPDYPAFISLPNTTVQFTDQSFNGNQWYWNFGDGIHSEEVNPSHMFMEPGEYYVTLVLENEFGCPSEVTKGPFIVLSPEVFIPNVFTPNDDGVNDVFYVKYTGDQPFLLSIFDRWGVKVYEGRDKYEGWNGKLKDKIVPEGVYYFVVMIGDKKYNGNVTLLR
jgi:gliding motility-associated-like protein